MPEVPEVKEEVTQPEEIQEPQVEPTEQVEKQPAPEEQPEGTPPEPEAPEAPVQNAPKSWKIKRGEEEVELTEEQLIENAQKGFDYTQKTQAVSEWEKARQQQIQVAEMLTQNPAAIKAAVAQQYGYDPMMVTTEAVPPDESFRETYPDFYWQQKARYEVHKEQKARFDQTVTMLMNTMSQSNNTALLEKNRIANELNEAEYGQVVQFVNENMRPNQMGMFSERQIEAAVKAVVGGQRESRSKLKTANNIQKTLQKAATSAVAKKPVSQRPEKLSDEEKEAREYKEYTWRMTGQKKD